MKTLGLPLMDGHLAIPKLWLYALITAIALGGNRSHSLDRSGDVSGLSRAMKRLATPRMVRSRVTTRLLIYKDVLYFGIPGQVESVSIADGKPIGHIKVPATPEGAFVWHRNGEEYSEYSYGVTTPEGKGFLLAFSDEFEKVLWSHEAGKPWTTGTPMSWRDVIVVGNCHGDIAAYEDSKGALKWRGHVDGCITGFEHDDSMLYISVKEGALFTFSPPARRRRDETGRSCCCAPSPGGLLRCWRYRVARSEGCCQ